MVRSIDGGHDLTLWYNKCDILFSHSHCFVYFIALVEGKSYKQAEPNLHFEHTMMDRNDFDCWPFVIGYDSHVFGSNEPSEPQYSPHLNCIKILTGVSQ